MTMTGGVLARYFGLRFLSAVLVVFAGIFSLAALIDYVELTRRASDIPGVSALLIAKTALYRIPQLTEKLMPFCVLIGAMSCYLNLSRRLELVIARAAGLSAWQFVAPAIFVAFVLGIFATAVYNPVSAIMQEQAKRLEASIFGDNSASRETGGRFWIRQRADDGEAIISARSSRNQGIELTGVTIFTFRTDGQFKERIQARSAVLQPAAWHIVEARIFPANQAPHSVAEMRLSTNLTPEQVRESFATPETVPFWDLPEYITIAERAGLVAAGYRLQFQKLLSRPFLLAAMVILAAAVSLRFFRFGGVQKMVLGGILAGFMLYVLQKITEDMAKAELMHPVAAAWLPALVGGVTGFVALLYQEDG
jgi:lipopolysaccharide export system permease protein